MKAGVFFSMRKAHIRSSCYLLVWEQTAEQFNRWISCWEVVSCFKNKVVSRGKTSPVSFRSFQFHEITAKYLCYHILLKHTAFLKHANTVCLWVLAFALCLCLLNTHFIPWESDIYLKEAYCWKPKSTSCWDFKTEKRANYYCRAQWHHEIFLLQNWFTEQRFIHFCVRKFKDCPVFCVYTLMLVPATAFYPEEGTVSNPFQNAYLNCICTVAGILWEALVTNKHIKRPANP